MPGEDRQIQDQTQSQTGTQSGTSANAVNSNQTGVTNSATGPWDPSKPLLNRLLEAYGGASASVTPEQAAAAKTLQTSTAGIPNFGADAAGVAGKLFGSDTSSQVGLLNKALSDYTANISKTASGSELDPYSTPGFGDALTTMQNDITNRVKGVYAGSGRDPSGAGSFAKSLGRGLTEGMAPVIAGQFNTNKTNQMNAAKSLFDASGGTAGQITSQGQVPLQNMISGVGLLPQITGAYTAPGAAQAGAADYAQSLPFGNLSRLLAPALQLAGAGTQTSGTTNTTGGSTSSGTTTGQSQSYGVGHGETVQPQSLLANILGGASGGLGILSALGGSGGAAAGLAML